MPVSTSLRGRVPGQALISSILSAQQDAPPRTVLARIFGANPISPSKRALYRAALGELAVGEMLDQLGPKWDILHVVPIHSLVPGENDGDEHDDTGIDHLVIGPPGVFAVLTENHPGQETRVSGDTMTVAGRERSDIATARRLADAAGEQLSAASGRTVTVSPVIVVIDSGKLVLRTEPVGVSVVSSKHLLRLLTRFDRALAGSEVAYISDIADRDSTWDFVSGPAEDAQQLTHDFARLRERVRDAAQVRGFWAVIGFAAICAAAWFSTLVIVERLLGS